MEEGNDQPRGGDHIDTLRNEEAFLQTDDKKPAIIAEPPPDPAQFKCWFCRKSHQQVGSKYQRVGLSASARSGWWPPSRTP